MRSNTPHGPRRSRSAPSSTRPARAPRTRPRRCVERLDVRDQRRRRGSLPSASSSTASLEVGPLVDPGTDQRQLAPEDAEEVDRRRRAWIATTTSAPAHARAARSPSRGPAAARDLEGDVHAGAAGPVVDQRGGVIGAAGSHGRETRAVLRRAARRRRSARPRATSAPVGARHAGDQQADRAAADDDRPLARGEPGAAHVVHGDRGRLDERGGVERERRRAGGRACLPGRSSAAASSRASRSR